MNKTVLIADSGSTKTDWVLVSPDCSRTELHTVGINPARDAREYIYNVFYHDLLTQLPAASMPQAIFFYGAGCIEPFAESIRSVLEALFPGSTIEVESDLLGAARALLGNKAGIACILGTGSNSCLYDGYGILSNTPPLGYVLGDEGSGAYLGKTLLNALYKGLFPSELMAAFRAETLLTLPQVIEQVYRKPAPNTFLASLVPFIARNRQHPLVHSLLVDAFCLFLERNVGPYGHKEWPVNCVGGIAYQFQEELAEAAQRQNMKIGKIMKRPIDGMILYHLNEHIN